MYLLLTLSAFESDAQDTEGLLTDFLSIHILMLGITCMLTLKTVKKVLGYEGI
mgnify:FL=1